jgi:translation initiation factor IF-1
LALVDAKASYKIRRDTRGVGPPTDSTNAPIFRPEMRVDSRVQTFRRLFRVAKTEPIELEAIVTQALPNAMFKLKVDGMDTEILGFVSGKMRKHFIRILPGDKVKVEITPYDLTKARIVFRQK